MTLAFRLPSALAALLAAALMSPIPASAQSSACLEGGKIFQDRQTILEQLGKLIGGGKKFDAIKTKQTCPIFTKMVANGETGTKWLEANKDWCQVPPQAAEGFVKEYEQMKKLRADHCQAAAKIATMEKQAREKAQQGGGGLLGGGGLTGEFKVPQGAL